MPEELLDLVEAVENAVRNLDPFNQGGAVTHPAYGYRCGNSEAAAFVLEEALRRLREYAESRK